MPDDCKDCKRYKEEIRKLQEENRRLVQERDDALLKEAAMRSVLMVYRAHGGRC